MTVRTITVTIPEMLFLQLEAAARASAQSLDSVVAQSLERAIPPHLMALLPRDLQAELQAMEHLSGKLPNPEGTELYSGATAEAVSE